jgi:hypothetical protein
VAAAPAPEAPAAKKAGLFAGLGTVSIKAAVTASLDDTEVSCDGCMCDAVVPVLLASAD